MTNTDHATLYVMRHGETEWNVKGLWQGHKNSPLTPEGIKDLKDIANELKHISFEAIYSADLGRTIHSAEIIRMERELEIKTSELLRERNFGSFEGKHKDEIQKEFTDLWNQFDVLVGKERYDFTFEGRIEDSEKVFARFVTILREISLANLGKTVLIVTSGGIMKSLLGRLDPDHYFSKVANGGYAKILCDGIDFTLLETKGVAPVQKLSFP